MLRLALLLALLYGGVWGELAKLHISAPEMYPARTDVVYAGSVTVVLVVNARECATYYTTDGQVPTPQSKEYSAPLHFFRPGNVTVRAISYPTDRRTGWMESHIVERTYAIGASSIPPPLLAPTHYRYRVGDAPQLVVHAGFEVHLQVVTAPTHPLALAKVGALPSHFSHTAAARCAVPCFVHLDHPGVAVLRAVASHNDDVSPVAQWTVSVTPALAYEVTTECRLCKGRPTVGEWFTVWLQGASRAASQLMLTTSSQGCTTQHQVLDDTGMVSVEPHKLSYRFRTFGDPGTVWVCLDEDNDGHFRRINLRGGRSNFTVQPQVRDVRRPSGSYTPAPVPTTLPPATLSPFLSTSQGTGWGGLAGLLVLFALLVALIVVVFRVARARQPAPRRRAAEAGDLEEREELGIAPHAVN